jgi:hypothetical protein
MANIIRPSRTTVGFSSKRIRLSASIDSPGAAEAGRSEAAEEASASEVLCHIE